MKYRELGRGGPEVSSIGYGAMSFTDFYGKTTRDASFAVMDALRDMGVNFLDTSNIYGKGRSEIVIGEYLAARGAPARDFFRIATKAGIVANPQSGARHFDNSAAYLEAELDGSLRRLGVDRVDLFYVHRRETARPIEEVTDTLVRLKASGKIGGFGFSEIAPYSLRRAHAVHPVMAVQSEYSLSTRLPELGMVQACAELGTALVAFSPVGRGLLSDDPPTPERVADLPFLANNPRFERDNLLRNLAASEGFRALAAELGAPACAVAVAWLLSRGAHVIPIPGTRQLAHLRELAQGVDLSLSHEDLDRIEACLPVGWAYGDRYSAAQAMGPERYS